MKLKNTTMLCSLLLVTFGFCPFGVATAAVAEQVYGGSLPSEFEKITIPAVENDQGHVECVELLKTLMAAPRTRQWREGRKLKVSWNQVQPGTAIATFKSGQYPQRGRRGSKHAAIFLRATHAGIFVFDQFRGQAAAAERFIPWHHPRDRSASNNAAAYSTVRW